MKEKQNGASIYLKLNEGKRNKQTKYQNLIMNINIKNCDRESIKKN